MKTILIITSKPYAYFVGEMKSIQPPVNDIANVLTLDRKYEWLYMYINVWNMKKSKVRSGHNTVVILKKQHL
jgi:hypothetical protein